LAVSSPSLAAVIPGRVGSAAASPRLCRREGRR
jgi:hypothetical protein